MDSLTFVGAIAGGFPLTRTVALSITSRQKKFIQRAFEYITVDPIPLGKRKVNARITDLVASVSSLMYSWFRPTYNRQAYPDQSRSRFLFLLEW